MHGLGKRPRCTEVGEVASGANGEQIISPGQGWMLLFQKEENRKSGAGMGNQVSTRAGRQRSISI